jgi:hypothetical protein
MSGSSIYLHLPANASANEFPENTNSSFKIRLANRLRLDGSKWEVALLDMMYPNNWHNVTQGVITVKKWMTDTDGQRIEGAEIQTDVELRKGRYRNLNELLKEIHAALITFGFESKFVFYYDDVRDLMFLIIYDKDYSLYLSEDLAAVFGFKANHEYTASAAETEESTNQSQEASDLEQLADALGPETERSRMSVFSPTSFQSPISPDLSQGFTSLYVYCSLCEPRLVGDSLVRLLRVMPIRNVKKEKDVSEEVRNPHYVRLANTDTDVVEVHISTDDGRPVAFKGGKVWMNLHLRRVE